MFLWNKSNICYCDRPNVETYIPAGRLEKTDYASDMWLICHRRPPVESQHYFQFSIPRQWPLCRRPACTVTLLCRSGLWLCQTDWCHRAVSDIYWNSIVSVPKGGGEWASSQLAHCTERRRVAGSVQWNREGSASNLNLTVWHTFVHRSRSASHQTQPCCNSQ